MGFQFAKPSDLTGGSFFKPGNHMNDLALLIEPKRLDRDVPNTYQSRTTNRDEVVCDITIFGTSESLEKGQPSEVLKNAKIVHGMLTKALSPIVGGAMVGVIRKIPTQAGSGYAFRDVDASVEAQVGNYFEQREAAVSEALASVPDFD